MSKNKFICSPPPPLTFESCYSQIKVSVIVPIYNVERYVERCIHSLLSQTLQEIEYIFVDDCSTDDSIEILMNTLKLYPNRAENVKIIHHDKNRGLTRARNSGLEIARGEYIAHCDSDDYVDTRMYELLYNKAVSTSADVVFCDFYLKYADRVDYLQTIDVSDKAGTLKKCIGGRFSTVVWNKLVKKTLYDNYKLKSPDHVTFCEDFHLSVRQIFYASIISKVNCPLYYYNQENRGSIVHNLSEKHRAEERLVYTEILDFFEKENCLALYEREMSWRILKNKQDMVLFSHLHDDFMLIFPWSHSYIASCPTYFCNFKIKIMMWLLTHHCRFVLLPILWLRKFMNR